MFQLPPCPRVSRPAEASACSKKMNEFEHLWWVGHENRLQTHAQNGIHKSEPQALKLSSSAEKSQSRRSGGLAVGGRGGEGSAGHSRQQKGRRRKIKSGPDHRKNVTVPEETMV